MTPDPTLEERQAAHGMNCAAWKNSLGEECGDPCTCGLIWRERLATAETMHAAWRKRAEEAEIALTRCEKQVAEARHLIGFIRTGVPYGGAEDWVERATAFLEATR